MKTFTKSLLKNGDILIKRNGDIEIACPETGTCIRKSGFNFLSAINEDFTNVSGEPFFDVIKVYRPVKPNQCAFDSPYHGLCMYDESNPDFRESCEMSISEIEQKLGISNLKIIKEE